MLSATRCEPLACAARSRDSPGRRRLVLQRRPGGSVSETRAPGGSASGSGTAGRAQTVPAAGRGAEWL